MAAQKSKNDAVILSATRTATGKFGGTLAALAATELGAAAVREAVRRSGVKPEQVDEVVLGNVVSAGLGQNPARQAALGGGLPPSVAAVTINKVCGSGLKAVILAAQAIRAGDAEIVVAGGMENMSRAPYLLREARNGLRLGHGKIEDAIIRDGLWCAFGDVHMGSTAEAVAREYNVSRAEQDRYSAESHAKAARAQDAGLFKTEILDIEIPGKKGEKTLFAVDETIRADSTPEGLAKLKPAFEKDGTVTAGNAPGLNDGAAALVVASRAKAEELGLEPLATIRAYATGGVEPRWVMMAPVEAVKRLFAKMAVGPEHFDLIESNEAFAVQAIAVGRQLGFNFDRVNVHGGAVALGHPIGASGARILTTLLHALAARGAQRGLATLCMGGGSGLAIAVERE
ncbi:MAG: acetyl-CoA C-acetyltransferase [Candidatus Wallbacteria bacterium]|nr:acetyl-CoA C-acetyltransferase [Candidatus Wallbacteria bacterium]